jgi:5-methylcytosine-specific restriction endonuclease McrA
MHHRRNRIPRAVKQIIDDHRKWRYLRWREQHARCYWCDIPVPLNSTAEEPTAMTLVHVVPISDGGADEYENVVMSCRSCAIKHNRFNFDCNTTI